MNKNSRSKLGVAKEYRLLYHQMIKEVIKNSGGRVTFKELKAYNQSD